MRDYLMCLVFIVLSTALAGTANANPSYLTLAQGSLSAGELVVIVQLEQTDPALRPVLADLRVNFDPGKLKFLRAESAAPQKAITASELTKGHLRLALTGFSLAPLNAGEIAYLIFKTRQATGSARIQLDAASSKVAPVIARRHIKIGPGLTVRLQR